MLRSHFVASLTVLTLLVLTGTAAAQQEDEPKCSERITVDQFEQRMRTLAFGDGSPGDNSGLVSYVCNSYIGPSGGPELWLGPGTGHLTLEALGATPGGGTIGTAQAQYQGTGWLAPDDADDKRISSESGPVPHDVAWVITMYPRNVTVKDANGKAILDANGIPMTLLCADDATIDAYITETLIHELYHVCMNHTGPGQPLMPKNVGYFNCDHYMIGRAVIVALCKYIYVLRGELEDPATTEERRAKLEVYIAQLCARIAANRRKWDSERGRVTAAKCFCANGPWRDRWDHVRDNGVDPDCNCRFGDPTVMPPIPTTTTHPRPECDGWQGGLPPSVTLPACPLCD